MPKEKTPAATRAAPGGRVPAATANTRMRLSAEKAKLSGNDENTIWAADSPKTSVQGRARPEGTPSRWSSTRKAPTAAPPATALP